MGRKIKLTLMFACLAALISAVYGLSTITFHQNLTIPTQQSIEVYQSDGTTLIASGSNQGTMWTWDNLNTRFAASINVKNVGNININIAITATGLNLGWTFSTSGSLTAITPGELRPIILYATNPSGTGGTQTGDFTVTVSIV